MNFSQRSYQKELLDADHIPFADIERNMHELDMINTLLGGHAITIAGFKNLVRNRKEIIVCEIGSGGGDNLAAIVKWCNKNKIAVRCIGIDLKKECIQVAKQKKLLQTNATWIESDYADVLFDSKPDIIFSSLFCHHFTNDQLIQQLQWMRDNSVVGFFINDLQRHWFAYHSIRILTKIFSSSYLVKNDAAVSVTRGFIKDEWEQLLNASNISATVQWKWAFRYLIVYRHG